MSARREIPAPLIALFIVAAWFALMFAAIDYAYSQSVGRVGQVGTLMIPDDGAAGAEPQPLGTLDTEADQGLQTESGEFLTVE